MKQRSFMRRTLNIKQVSNGFIVVHNETPMSESVHGIFEEAVLKLASYFDLVTLDEYIYVGNKEQLQKRFNEETPK